MSDWFATLFGFSESAVLRGGGGFAEVQRSFRMDGDTLVSQANGRSFDIGPWEQVPLKTLRGRCVDAASVGHSRPETTAADAGAGTPGGHHRVVDKRDQTATFSNIGKRNAAALHKDPANGGAVFQVASQFNCLEMVGPGVTPEHGVTMYEKDHTQGPACALACPGATVFRNYLVNGTGQAGPHQIDLLSGVGQVVNNPKHAFWIMRNGYALPVTPKSIAKLGTLLSSDAALHAAAKEAVEVGVHWSTAVSLKRAPSAHTVTQVFCSALPVAYAKGTQSTDWEPFARLVLGAAYEATLLAACALSTERGGARVRVYLTLLGGGAFGNRSRWIYDAIAGAMAKVKAAPLDVVLVHFGPIPADAAKLEASLRSKIKQ